MSSRTPLTLPGTNPQHPSRQQANLMVPHHPLTPSHLAPRAAGSLVSLTRLSHQTTSGEIRSQNCSPGDPTAIGRAARPRCRTRRHAGVVFGGGPVRRGARVAMSAGEGGDTGEAEPAAGDSPRSQGEVRTEESGEEMKQKWSLLLPLLLLLVPGGGGGSVVAVVARPPSHSLRFRLTGVLFVKWD